MRQLLKKWFSTPDKSKNPKDLDTETKEHNPASISFSSGSQSQTTAPQTPKEPLSHTDTKKSIINSESVLDTAEALPRFAHREDLYRMALQKVVETYKDAADQLQKILDSGKMEDGKFLSHTLKGVMGNIGAKQIFVLASHLEEAFSNNRKKEAADRIKDLSSIMQAFVSHVREVCHSEFPQQEALHASYADRKAETKKLINILNQRRPSDCSKAIQILESIRANQKNTGFRLDIDTIIHLIEEYEFDKAIDKVAIYYKAMSQPS